MNTDERFLFKPLQENSHIVFGPFIGELGWEITRWCGFVRWFKSKYPEKQIVVSTRSDRIDLYHRYVDGIMAFDIEGDYEEYRPNMYRLDKFPEENYKKLIKNIEKNFKDFYIASPPRLSRDRNIFKMEMMNYDFIPRDSNIDIISSILKTYNGKIPIVISPRHRIDFKDIPDSRIRNWKQKFWFELFQLIENTGRYVCFIAGKSPSYIRPPKELKSFVVLEDYDLPTIKGISLIGLTLESIRVSKITVGQQSSIPVLSNYMKKQTLMWGDEKHRHQVLENPYKTRCEFFEEKDSNYIVDPKLIVHNIIKMTEGK